LILDATAANRTMWINKDVEHIIYMDMEKKLTVKPDIFCMNTQSPFRDATFDIIFYDPPHFFNDTGSFYSIPDKETYLKKWQGYGEIPRYYGGDKYKTQAALIHHVFDAQKEFQRILKPDGLLWLKWNETYITIHTVMHLFENWSELLRIPVRLSNPNRTQKQTYWVCLCKKKQKLVQVQLI
jgi:DNA modification methylase